MKSLVRAIALLLTICGLLTPELTRAAPSFNARALAKIGDSVKYGSYVVYKVGDGVFKINDPGVTTGKGGAWGVDIYLVRGKSRALVIDLGNNYITGYAPDLIAPRANAAEEFRAIVFGLAGALPVEAAITHAHPDHDGMTGAFLDIPQKVTLWMPDGEDINAPKAQYGIDPGVYTRFAPGKQFDLGGRTVRAIQVRGHTDGSTVYLLTPDMDLFTGDALGSGFGQAFPTVARLKVFAQDASALVADISSHSSPYERYALKVFTGHSWQNTYAGWWSPKHAKIDVAYLDWRFVQDVASCANAILKGDWLVPGSGLQYVGNMEYTDAWPTASGRGIMVYGIGTVIIPLETAYEASGLPMPAHETPKTTP
jgi:glyoxylase-like metal-dependent hydrolase (beta-lactamase superfamily II)